MARILGCYYQPLVKSNVDAYVVVAGGYFHAVGLALALGMSKPVYRADPYTGMVENVTDIARRWLAKRYWVIRQAMNAQRFGVIVGLFPGQYRPGVVDTVTKLLKRAGRDYKLLYSERLNREYLDNLSPDDYDAFIVTSCPRLAIEDLGDYWKPVLTPGEAFMAITGRLERYRFPW